MLWKIPDRDEDRINAIRAAVNREEILPEAERSFLDGELLEFNNFVRQYEGEKLVLQRAQEDRNKSLGQYKERQANARMYISHFIQVLQLTAIRNEIRAEHLDLYGFEKGKEYEIPDLLSEEAILKWGENIIRGESERLMKGGIPLYNPAIAKVKVHFELFKEIIQSLKIYRQNAMRYQVSVAEMRKKAGEYIYKIWSKISEKYKDCDKDKQREIFDAYRFCFYKTGEQLNVFD
jgi:hypothetical protein